MSTIMKISTTKKTLWEFCAHGNLKSMQELLEGHPNLLNESDESQSTLLHYAVRHNRANIVTFLIEKGCNINCNNFLNETPLLSGAKRNFVEIMQILIENGADIASKNKFGETCLHYCAWNNSSEAALYLSKLTYIDHVFYETDAKGDTAVHSAIQAKSFEVFKILSLHHSQKDVLLIRNSEGYTPALLALRYNCIDIIEFFQAVYPDSFSGQDAQGNTALHLAACYSTDDATVFLIKNGAMINTLNSSQDLPLHLAVTGNNIGTVSVLLRYDADMDSQNASKYTPVMLASQLGCYEVVEILLSKNCNVLFEDELERNCLEIAIDENYPGIAELFIKSKHGSKLLRHCSLTRSGTFTTPLRKLIENMPDVAKIVFDQCITGNNFRKDDPSYALEMRFDILEDVYSNWGGPLKEPPLKNKKSEITCGRIKKVSYNDIYSNFPLILMVKKERLSLLQHTLVFYCLKNKWNKNGQYFYYIQLLMYTLNIILLTGYAFRVDKVPTSIVDGYCYPDMEIVGTEQYFFLVIAPIILLIFCILDMITKIMSIIWERNSHTVKYIFELFSCSVNIIFIISGLYGTSPKQNLLVGLRCSGEMIDVGAASVMLTYACFLLFMRKIPILGTYVVVYVDILTTFLTFIPLYFMFVIGFGVSFYMMFNDKPDSLSFTTFTRSCFKTFIATVEGVDFDSFYNDSSYTPKNFSWAVIFFFVICITIVFMNMLVGLAVDDIQGTKQNAKLKKLALQVELSMGIESILPYKLNEKNALLFDRIYPNVKPGWSIPRLIKFLAGFKNKPEQPMNTDDDDEANKDNRRILEKLAQVEKRLDKLDDIERCLRKIISKI